MRQLLKCIVAAACALPLATMAVTTTGYEQFGDTDGVVLWRGTQNNFHESNLVDVGADGNPGDEYTMNTSGHPWQVFARGQSAYTSPGKVLVYDTPGTGDGYKYNPDCTFTPISFGGMWVQTLAINGQPFSILGNNAGKRYTEFGASDKSTLFKFDASFTINRTSTTTFFGEATVDIAQDATFTAQADSNYGVEVDSAATLKLKGAGTLAVTTMNVAGTLDLSATTRPTIAGNVTLGGTIILPAGTEVSPGSPFTVCSGTLSAANVNVKIGDAEAVLKSLTVSGGAITALGDPVYEYTENYPTVVPAGQVYTFIGGETAEAATTASGVTVNGTLKTRGYISLSGITTAKESMLEVEDGTATVTASAAQSLTGDITIDAGATMVNAMTADALNYGWGVYVRVYGTLDMGSTRWTVGSNARIHLYEGGLITGAGQGSNGAIDITSANVRVIAHGNSTISANMRVRNENIPIEAEEGKTLTISGLINDGAGYSQPGSITKQNSGTLVLTTAPTFTKALKLEAGTLELGGTAASSSVTVAASAATVAASSGSTLTGELIFVSHIPSATNKALIASEAFDGAVVLTGTIGTAADITGLGAEVTLRDFTGFLNKSASTSGIKVNVEGTFTQSDGWSYDSDRIYLAEIKGNGTMTHSGAQAQLYEVGSIENFTGTFNLTNARIKSNNNAVLDKAQTIATLTVAKTLTVTGGSLTGNLVAKDVAVTVDGTPAAGDVLVPVTGTASVSGTVTVNGNKAAVECVTGEGVKFVAYLVSVNVPKVANTTIEVSVGGTPVTPATEGETTNTYSVASGATVTVTYTSDDYEVTGGSFVFTASEGYTVDATAVTTAAYMASITVGETTTKYSSLQAAVTAAAAINNGKMLLLASAAGMDATIPAPASGGRVQFYIAANGNAEGTVNAPAGDYIMTTASETIQIGSTDYGATKYTVVEAAVAVTIGTSRSLYGASYISDAVSAAIAGGLGSTIEFVNGTDSTPYVSALEASGFTLENNVWTFTTLPVAKVTHGVTETSYITLAAAFANAQAGDTIKVLADNTVTNAIQFSVSLTLDLGGKTITGPANGYALVNAGADITIIGEGTVEGAGIVSNATSTATTTISGGTYTSTGDLFAAEEGSTIAVTGGTFNRDVTSFLDTAEYKAVNNGNGTYTVRKINDDSWIYSAPGSWESTGTWEGATLGDEKVTIETNATYTASAPSANDLVTLNMTLSFDDANDDETDLSNVKGAVRLGLDNNNYVFQLATWDGADAVWTNATAAVAATTNTNYQFMFVLDLSTKTYTASVITDAGATTNALTVAGSTTIAFANYSQAATPVQELAFVGAGSLTSLIGSYEAAPAPAGFVENEEVALSGGSKTLSEGEAAWLNACGDKATVGGKIGNLSAAAFNRAYLLNLDVCDDNYSDVEKPLSVTAISVGDTTVTVTVTLTHNGAFVSSGINGTLKLKGAAELGTAFEEISTAEFVDEDFSESDTTSTTFSKGDDPAKFYQAEIE